MIVGLLGGPTFADLTGDGAPEVVAGTAGTIKLIDAQAPARQENGHHQISAWDPETRHMLNAFPRIVEDLMFFGNPTVADLDGDGVGEIVTGNGGGFVHAVNHLGAQPPGWPKFTNGWMIPIPVVGDVDNDGLLEATAMSREGFLTIWDLPGPVSPVAVQWQGFRHDRQRTGSLGSGVAAGLIAPGCDAGSYPLALKLARLTKRTTPNTDRLRVRGSFRVAGNTFDAGSEDVAVSLSGVGTAYATTLTGGLEPMSSGFKFNGTAPGGEHLSLKLRTRDGLSYKVSASANGFSAGGSALPLGTVRLRIGNDCYEISLPCESRQNGQREVCKPAR